MSKLVVKSIKHPTAADSDSIQLDTNGNVGIGTSSPTTKLSVVSGTNAGISVNDETVNTIIYNTNSVQSSIGTTTNHPFSLWTNNAERMRIDESGNVGIGTNSPSSLLHLKSTGPAILTLEADTDNATETDNARIELSQDGGLVTGSIGYQNNTNDLEFWQNEQNSLIFGTNNTERMRIDGSGYVTKPNQPCFIGRLDAGGGTNYVVGISAIYNVNMSFNATTDRITVPKTGYYMIHAQQLFTSSGAIFFIVRKNGATLLHGYGNLGSTHRDLAATLIYPFSANDYIDFYLSGTATNSWTGGHSLCFVQLVQ